MNAKGNHETGAAFLVCGCTSVRGDEAVPAELPQRRMDHTRTASALGVLCLRYGIGLVLTGCSGPLMIETVNADVKCCRSAFKLSSARASPSLAYAATMAPMVLNIAFVRSPCGDGETPLDLPDFTLTTRERVQSNFCRTIQAHRQ
jgi:hypothetical protein